MIYSYQSYKNYLSDIFNLKENRGIRKRIAEFLGCRPGFISQVLTGDKTHFSLEHLERIGSFLKLKKGEIAYLILMGQYEKAGSVHLQNLLKEQMEEKQKLNKNIKEKISKRGQVLADQDKVVYYGHWAYMAVHMIVSIPEFQTRKSIQRHFKLPQTFINRVIDFLVEAELIEEKQEILTIGKTRIHIDSNSPFISSLHQNLRLKAIQSLENDNEIDIHYSSVLILSKSDIEKIRDLILKFIKDKEEILLPSAEEDIVALNIDYFKI